MVNFHSTPFTLESDLLESMTDEQFLRFCRDNPRMRFERTADKKIVVMSPNGSKSGRFHFLLAGQLFLWMQEKKKGVAFDSSAGFTLPDGSIKAPDLAWMNEDKWLLLSDEERDGFAPACPDFVVELRSKSDALKPLLEKMEVWIQNGVQLGFLIDPLEQRSYIFRGDGRTEQLDGFERSLSGEELLPGFRLNLSIFLD